MDSDGSIRWYFIIIITVLIASAAFFASSETAFSYCNKTRIKARVEDGDKKAKKVQKVLDSFDNTIIAILIGTNISHIVSSTLATIFTIALLGEIGSLVSTVVMTLLVFIFCETLPKNIARTNPDKLAERHAGLILFFMKIFTPLTCILQLPFKIISKRLGEDEEPEITEEDLQTIVETIEEEGVLDEDESTLIQSAIEFDDIAVKEVYTPVNKIVAIDINTPRKEVIKILLNEERYSRLPVYDKTIDNIVGVLPVRKCLNAVLYRKNVAIWKLMSKPYFVALGTKLDDIVDGFSKNRTHMGIVVDKGKTIGIITMDDALEELIGDIVEETKEGDEAC